MAGWRNNKIRPAAPQRRLRCTAALKTEHTVDLTEESLAALQESPAFGANHRGESRAGVARMGRLQGGARRAAPLGGQLALISALPMVGFGFMDNFIMLLAGDFIDASLGFKLGLTTLCAAGLKATYSPTSSGSLRRGR